MVRFELGKLERFEWGKLERFELEDKETGYKGYGEGTGHRQRLKVKA